MGVLLGNRRKQGNVIGFLGGVGFKKRGPNQASGGVNTEQRPWV